MRVLVPVAISVCVSGIPFLIESVEGFTGIPISLGLATTFAIIGVIAMCTEVGTTRRISVVATSLVATATLSIALLVATATWVRAERFRIVALAMMDATVSANMSSTAQLREGARMHCLQFCWLVLSGVQFDPVARRAVVSAWMRTKYRFDPQANRWSSEPD